jgi:serine phosphatase RsbU (regulator of sigma subunit)
MPDVVVGLEIVAILALALLAWRRARPASSPFTRELLTIAVAVVAQTVLLLAYFPLAGSLSAGGAPSPAALTRLAAAHWAVQLARTLLLVGACVSWAAIVKGSGRLPKSLPLVPACLVAMQVGGGWGFLGGLVLLILLYRARWSRGTGRWRRLAYSFLGGFFCLAVLGLKDSTSLRPTAGAEAVTFTVADGGWTVEGGLPERAGRIVGYAEPLSRAAGAAFSLLVLQGIAAFLSSVAGALRLGVPGLTLRGLSLERRFTVTYALVRLVPAAVLVAVLALGIPLALGMHKTIRARAALRTEILRAVPLADAVLDSAGVTAPIDDASRWEGALAAARHQHRPPLGEAHVVLRQTPFVVGAAGADRASRPPSDVPDDPFAVSVATPGTPSALRARSPFTEFPGDTLGGLVEAGGTLYLATARIDVGDTDPGMFIAEVFVPVDTAFVNRLAREIGVDIEIRTTPRTRIARTATTLSLSPGDTTVTVPEIRMRSGEPSGRAAAGFWHRPRYLGQETTVLGDWLHLPISGPGVVLTYHASAAQIAAALSSAGFLLVDSSIGLPRVALALLILLIAEVIAVRMGRGITRSILEDVRVLTDAARRFGRGDLEHRVTVRGKDELASLAGSFNTMAEDLRRQQAELVEKERIEEDLSVAREIQTRFLPQSPPAVPGVEMAGVSIPSREVGGDLYYFLRLSGGRVGVALGDVSGKSIPAALLMSSVLAGLRAQTQFGADVHDAISNMNRLLVDDIEPGRFVTFFFGAIDPAAGVIRYACAGHNPPLKMSAGGAVEWLTEAGVPLGILPDAEYRAATAALSPGDVLVLYSDGISEAEGPPIRAAGGESSGEEPEQFGVERLVETVRALRTRAPAEIVDGTVEAVRRFGRGVAQSDDITLVVVKIAPTASAPHRA